MKCCLAGLWATSKLLQHCNRFNFWVIHGNACLLWSYLLGAITCLKAWKLHLIWVMLHFVGMIFEHGKTNGLKFTSDFFFFSCWDAWIYCALPRVGRPSALNTRLELKLKPRGSWRFHATPHPNPQDSSRKLWRKVKLVALEHVQFACCKSRRTLRQSHLDMVWIITYTILHRFTIISVGWKVACVGTTLCGVAHDILCVSRKLGWLIKFI